jgi:hypothetical protein
MVEDDRVENLDLEGYCSLWKMLQGRVRDGVRTRSVADRETPDGSLNLVRVS